MWNLTFDGKVALVTGGSRGIGREIALSLGRMGAKVGVNFARNEEAAAAVVREIKEAGGDAIFLKFDIAKEDEVETGIKILVEKFGKLDFLVNNAGLAVDGLILRMKSEDWHKTIETNLTGAFYCTRAAAKLMLKNKSGKIVNISSVIGEMGNAGQSAYAASKSALFGFTKSLARELGSRAITVNTITPGYIDTDMTSGISDEQRQQLFSQVPLARLGTPADVAGAVLFLLSPWGDYVTGEIIAVNGGLHM
jgi:3-oxoacyl-[acyl-carrier protein] reductase